MAKLTQEMKEMFSKQLAIIATVNEDNTPNLGPKASLRIYDDTKFVFNEKTGGRTFENIQRDGNVAIIIVDKDAKDGYRFIGKARAYTEGKYYDEALEWANGTHIPKAAVIIEIERIDTLKSGPTAGKTISE